MQKIQRCQFNWLTNKVDWQISHAGAADFLSAINIMQILLCDINFHAKLL